MRKSYFLFLLLLLSVIGSVNASETITLPETCSQSSYFIVIAGYDEETIIGTLNNTVWDDFAPNICGISGNTIYVSSEADMARLLQPLLARSTTYASVCPSALITTSKTTVVYHGYLQQEGGTSDTFQDTYLYLNNTELVKGYMLYRKGCYFSYDGGRGEIYLNDVVWGLSASGNPGTLIDSVSSILPFNSVVHWDVDERWDWGADAFATIVIFGEGANNGTFEGSYVDRFTKTEFDSAVVDITFNTNSVDGIEVLEGENSVGTINDGSKLTLSKGSHTLTFVKNGFSYTTTIDTNSVTSLDVPFRTITVAMTDSEGGLSSVNCYVDGDLISTLSNNQNIVIPDGTYELIFEKPGYWNETRTVTVDETLTDLTIRMYPESVFFKISNTPVEITTYSNSEVNIALNIDPNDYAYGVKLYLTGQEVLDVRDSSNVQISKQDSYYLLDDFSSAKTVNVKINSGTTLGTNSLAVRVTGYNSIGTEFVTDTTVDYEIVRLPLSLTVPNWCIGSNSLTVIETEGDSRTVTIKVEDSESNIIYTDTYTLEGFETHKFNIDFEETGDYKLYIQSGDLINTYIDVSVNNPVTLETKTITASAGSTTSVTVSIENPFTEPQYYRITIEGDPLTNATKVDFSVSPGSSKAQSISFTLLDELDYDSYSLPLKVYLVEESGLTEIYSDSVILNIGSSGSFIPFIDLGDDGIIDTVITLVIDNPVIDGIIIIAGLGVFISSGRKKGKKPVKTIKKPIVKKGGKKGGK
jgi:hypothetical protein